MPTPSFSEPIRRLWGLGSVSGLREGALLDRFLKFEDESAFEAILSRHGPMVLAVCRRFLRDPHDVEDAFQATFLILARKASGLRDREALGPWLYGVAYRVAIRARSRPRASVEDLPEPADRRSETADQAIERDEAIEALHEELARLPEKYRDPIVLCHLEGLTHELAAERLNWPVGTVRGRLWRGRDKLRERLTRRGFGDDPETLFTASRTTAERKPVPGGLVPITLATAARLAAGGSFRWIAASSVASLSKGVLGMMFWNSIKGPIVLTAALGVLGIGAVTTAHLSGQPRADQPAQDQAQKNTEGSPTVPARNPVRKSARVLNDGDAPEKIRVAQKKYDDQMNQLGQERGEVQGEIEILETELKAQKDAFAKLYTDVRTAKRLPDEELNDATVRIEKLRHEIRATALGLEEARRRSESLDRRLQTLWARPRPVERVEVQPGDTIRIEVLEALPGRPISGDRTIRPDGKITLDFYGELFVAGLTPIEIKEMVILRLRKFLNDDTLGLVETDPRDPDAPVVVQPRDSDRVFVDLDSDRPTSQRTNRTRP